MELVTDILAIAGWGLFGVMAPWLKVFHFNESDEDGVIAIRVLSVSFALIAANVVLGN